MVEWRDMRWWSVRVERGTNVCRCVAYEWRKVTDWRKTTRDERASWRNALNADWLRARSSRREYRRRVEYHARWEEPSRKWLSQCWLTRYAHLLTRSTKWWEDHRDEALWLVWMSCHGLELPDASRKHE